MLLISISTFSASFVYLAYAEELQTFNIPFSEFRVHLLMKVKKVLET